MHVVGRQTLYMCAGFFWKLALNGSNQNPFMEVIYNLQQTTTKIHDLEPGTAYSISIEAHTAIGGGPTKYISESTLQLSGSTTWTSI